MWSFWENRNRSGKRIQWPVFPETPHSYSLETLKKACDKALEQYHMSYYRNIYVHAKSINRAKELMEFKENYQKSGIIRGTDHYRKSGADKMDIEMKKSGVKWSCKDYRSAGKRYITLMCLGYEKRPELLLETLNRNAETGS